MKKILPLLSVILSGTLVPAYAQYVTPGSHANFTFSDLAAIPESGVIADDLGFIISSDLQIATTDTLEMENKKEVRLADGVTIEINGYARFTPADYSTITRLNDEAVPRGVYLRDSESCGEIRNMIFEYAGLRYNGTGQLNISESVFRYIGTALSSSGAITLGDGGSTVITSTHFIENESAAIGSAANAQHGVTLIENYFFDNNTQNSNRPQINLTSCGDKENRIESNVIIGTQRNKVGGIALGNLLGMEGANKVVIKNNTITKCRYGITAIGPFDVEISNNSLIDNQYEENPMNGGSGISIYDSSQKLTARITGNYIEKHLWGITLLGGKEINIGKTDSSLPDYNPGQNVFVDNGNGGLLYDLYNNTPLTVYAQGNTWNVDEQSAEKIESVIYHQADDPSLGEVIYQSADALDPVHQVRKIFRLDNYSDNIIFDVPCDRVRVCSLDGKVLLEKESVSDRLSLNGINDMFLILSLEKEGRVSNHKISR